jgi:uncharacterized membrane protein YgdD (TMEM256/DUF423 family)
MLAVGCGAFGAHALKERLETLNTTTTWQTASHYHLAHALALVLVALLCDRLKNTKALQGVGWLFLGGILLFSGSLYALALTGIRVLGVITPLGGVCFLAAWLLLLVSGIQSRE